MTNDDLLLLQTSVFTGITTDEIRDMLFLPLCTGDDIYQRRDHFFLWGNHHRHRHCAGRKCTHCKRGLLGQCQSDGRMCPGRYFRGSLCDQFHRTSGNEYFCCFHLPHFVSGAASKILTVCPSACAFHNRLIRNLLTLVSRKNFQLNRKLEHMSKRTTREKLLSYLSMESKKANASTFTIPFNRQQLADYLSVDRSAMSNELCKLRDAGILEFNKNTFTIFEKND